MERRPYPGWRRPRRWEVRSLGDWEKTSKKTPNLQVFLSPSSESNPELLGTDPGGSTIIPAIQTVLFLHFHKLKLSCHYIFQPLNCLVVSLCGIIHAFLFDMQPTMASGLVSLRHLLACKLFWKQPKQLVKTTSSFPPRKPRGDLETGRGCARMARVVFISCHGCFLFNETYPHLHSRAQRGRRACL